MDKIFRLNIHCPLFGIDRCYYFGVENWGIGTWGLWFLIYQIISQSIQHFNFSAHSTSRNINSNICPHSLRSRPTKVGRIRVNGMTVSNIKTKKIFATVPIAPWVIVLQVLLLARLIVSYVSKASMYNNVPTGINYPLAICLGSASLRPSPAFNLTLPRLLSTKKA